MTKYQALLVKYWRVRCEGSWSWVAEQWNKRYAPHMNPLYNGVFGRSLCFQAMTLLNEKVEDGWN